MGSHKRHRHRRRRGHGHGKNKVHTESVKVLELRTTPASDVHGHVGEMKIYTTNGKDVFYKGADGVTYMIATAPI